MKCPNCGCADFCVSTLRTGPCCAEGGAWEPIEFNGRKIVAYLCKKCGRIELFSPESVVDIQEKEQEEAKKEAERIAEEKRMAALIKEKEQLEAIVNDENQTVKEYKKAKNRLEKINKEIKTEPRGNR